MAPHGRLGLARNCPPWASMIVLQIESPMPMPLDFVVLDLDHQHRPVEIGVQLRRKCRGTGEERRVGEFFEFSADLCGVETSWLLDGVPTLERHYSR
jgi:hypothetical protein